MKVMSAAAMFACAAVATAQDGTGRDLLFSDPTAELPDVRISESVKYVNEGSSFYYTVELTHKPGMREDQTVDETNDEVRVYLSSSQEVYQQGVAAQDDTADDFVQTLGHVVYRTLGSAMETDAFPTIAGTTAGLTALFESAASESYLDDEMVAQMSDTTKEAIVAAMKNSYDVLEARLDTTHAGLEPWKLQVVDTHNSARSQHCAQNLAWSATLAAAAQAEAASLRERLLVLEESGVSTVEGVQALRTELAEARAAVRSSQVMPWSRHWGTSLS